MNSYSVMQHYPSECRQLRPEYSFRIDGMGSNISNAIKQKVSGDKPDDRVLGRDVVPADSERFQSSQHVELHQTTKLEPLIH